jgi:hypothetical protein
VARLIELHIEELTLRGFSRRDGLRMGDALRAEIERLLATQGLSALPRVDVAIPRIDAGAFKTAQGARAETTGAQIAQRLLGGLSGGVLDHRPSGPGSAKK